MPFFKSYIQRHMLQLNINDEISQLKAVVLGIARSSGPTPTKEEAYDC